MTGDSHLSALLSARGCAVDGARKPRKTPLALGCAEVDGILDGGLMANGVHEFYAATKCDTASATGFALLLAAIRRGMDGRGILWAREARAMKSGGHPYGPGIADLDIDPDALTLLVLPDAKAVLRAALDSVRDGCVAAIVVELASGQRLLDLTASRRFALAAAESETTALFVCGTAKPAPSAAHTRWRVAAAPSRALAANAPGPPAFALELLRQRGGRDGLKWVMEWDRASAKFRSRKRAAEPSSLPRPRPAVVIGGTGDTRRSRAA